jgi:sugar lactone lactonase YvrE
MVGGMTIRSTSADAVEPLVPMPAADDVCSNGIDWSPDGRWLYFVGSRAHVIYRYRFDVESGSVAERRAFADAASIVGVPDGLRVDAAGDIWCTVWDGTVAQTVSAPAPRPTSLAFGGPDLRTMFITSASIGLTEVQLSGAPLSGSVLSRDADVPGRPSNRYHRVRKASPC